MTTLRSYLCLRLLLALAWIGHVPAVARSRARLLWYLAGQAARVAPGARWALLAAALWPLLWWLLIGGRP